MSAKRGVQERIDSFYTPVTESGCHLWLGALSTRGYGRIMVDGKVRNAHRVSWQLAKGPIPDGAFLCHKCDTRSCINPEHLFVGDQASNMADVRAKRRWCGISHRSKLTPEQVIDIRKSPESGSRMARKYGVHPSTIHEIIFRKTWSHI